MPSAVDDPASPLAASFNVPSPPSTTTASRRCDAAPWARRVACPRRDVSAVVTSWSADSAFWITTRTRSVTDDADVLTMNSSFTTVPPNPCRLLLGDLAQLRKAARQEPGHVHLADVEPVGDLRLRQPLEEAQMQDRLLARRERLDQRREGGAVLGVDQPGVLLAHVG